jgi:hypothetical protein
VVCPKCDYKNVLSSYGTFQCLDCGHRFTGQEVKGKEDYVCVHKISGKTEKIHFGLERKYRPLREKILREYHLEREAYWRRKDEGPVRDKIDRHWDLEQIYLKAILDWDGETPPPVWFQNTLEWGIKNMGAVYKDRLDFRKRFEEAVKKEAQIKCKDCSTSFLFSEATGDGECPVCGAPIDPQDPEKVKEIKTFTLREDKDFEGGYLDDPVEDEEGEEITRKVDLFKGEAGVSSVDFDPINPKAFFLPEDYNQLRKEQEGAVLRSAVSRLVDRFDDQIDKLLLLDLYDSYCCNRKPTSNAKMSRLLVERGIKMTPQGIGKRREKLYRILQEYFSK